MQLDLTAYRDKVKACWIGKNIGGTMGTPYEHMEQVLDIQGFATAPGEVLPNDDLDLQLVCLFALERVMGVEPTSPAWKAGVIAVIRHPHRGRYFFYSLKIPNNRQRK